MSVLLPLQEELFVAVALLPIDGEIRKTRCTEGSEGEKQVVLAALGPVPPSPASGLSLFMSSL